MNEWSGPKLPTAAQHDTAWVSSRGDKWRAHLAGMEAMLASVDAPLLQALRLDAPARIAEIGCGGGGTTLQLARGAPAGSVVHGYDLSPGLIEVARQRLHRDQPAVAFLTADMATAPAPLALYDRLVSRFGIMFFAEPAAAFCNLSRWLAVGGRFAFAVWGPLADNPWLHSVGDVVAEHVALPALETASPGPFRYAEPEPLLALLHSAGLAELETRCLRTQLPIGGGLPAERAAQFALAAFSSFSELLARAGDGAAERAQQALSARFLPHERAGVVLLNASIWLITGVRAGG